MYSKDIVISIVIPTCDRKESLLRLLMQGKLQEFSRKLGLSESVEFLGPNGQRNISKPSTVATIKR